VVLPVEVGLRPPLPVPELLMDIKSPSLTIGVGRQITLVTGSARPRLKERDGTSAVCREGLQRQELQCSMLALYRFYVYSRHRARTFPAGSEQMHPFTRREGKNPSAGLRAWTEGRAAGLK
jgi:hypothetical protein